MLRESKFRRVFMVFSHLQLWGKRCEKITSEEESLLWSDVKPCAMSALLKKKARGVLQLRSVTAQGVFW